MAIIPQSIKMLLAKTKASTVDGIATAYLKIPVDREIVGGLGCFANQHPADYLEIDIADEDNIYGFGAGAILGSFNDEFCPSANQGWYFLNGNLDIMPLVENDPSKLDAGLYLKIVGTKHDLSADDLFVNIRWGLRLR